MDPGPSSASADPSPPEEEEEEGEGDSSSRWVVVPGNEVLGASAPKVVGWEELQHELARLWSLSAALAAARGRKAGLAARLESTLEARKTFLQQDNELAEMRQRVQSHADFMGELRMQTKELSANVEDRREQLCVKIRTLTVAEKTVGAAQSKLQGPGKLLSGDRGHGRLKSLERMLRMRQQYMIGQVAQIYPVKHLKEQSLIVKPGLNSSIVRTGRRHRLQPPEDGHTPTTHTHTHTRPSSPSDYDRVRRCSQLQNDNIRSHTALPPAKNGEASRLGATGQRQRRCQTPSGTNVAPGLPMPTYRTPLCA